MVQTWLEGRVLATQNRRKADKNGQQHTIENGKNTLMKIFFLFFV
jgi:hypothetical protein